MLYDVLIVVIADWLVIPIVIVGGLAMLMTSPKGRLYQTLARSVVAGMVALLLAKCASLLYQGERPFVESGSAPKAAYLDNPGFPSDHALLVFAVAFIVWAATKNVRLSIALLIMAMLVAVGRVLALVHTPLDVTGGIVCAFVAVALVYGRQFFRLKT